MRLAVGTLTYKLCVAPYGKTEAHVVVRLKTVKVTKQHRFNPSIYEAIVKEKIVFGDVI
jgi:RuvB-like protein 1 (pontin 52)